MSSAPKNKTGSSVVKKKVEAAAKTGVLSLTEHKLEKVPSVVVKELGGAASKLRTLDLSANKLEALPDFAGAFPKLRTCKLHRNRLAALPAFGGALVSLDLSENRVTSAGLEACLAEAAALEELRCARNPLGAGCGPAALAKLAKLRIFVASDCGLTALLLFDGALWPALVEVVADGNAIAGLDDALAARAPALRRLSLEPVWKPNLQPDFNVSVFERFGPDSFVVLRELDESDRSVQKSAESTSM